MKSMILSSLVAGILLIGCGSSGGASDGSPDRKKAGNACIINRVACASMPSKVCAAGRGLYQPFTCPSVGFNIGPCSTDAYGPIYAKSQVICNRIRAQRR